MSDLINRQTSDLISRQMAIDALWKALYEYEDKTEKQFQESEDLDIRDWAIPRIFVQNMSDIDRKTILGLPSAQPEIIRCKDCKHYQFADNRALGMPVKICEWFGFKDVDDDDFCSRAERKTNE